MMDLSAKKMGFGTMRLPLLEDGKTIDQKQFEQMVDEYLAAGFTYFDTAYPYHEGRSELAVREALVKRYPRERFQLADKMPIYRANSREDYERIFAEQLEKTGAGYFDVYLLHNIGTERYGSVEQLDGFGFLAEKKAQGLIRRMGFSFHDSPELLDTILTDHPEVEVVLLQLNYLDWDSPAIQSRRCLEVCARHGKAALVMEPIRGGTLAALPEAAEQRIAAYQASHPAEGGLSAASYAIRFAASQNVERVLSGMSNLAQLRDNLSYMADFRPLSEGEAGLVEEIVEILNRTAVIPCTGCKYCLEVCPKQINIPVYFGLFNLNAVTGKKSELYYRRASLNGGRALDCVGCGRCEHNFPQHIEIRRWLKEFAAVYEAGG